MLELFQFLLEICVFEDTLRTRGPKVKTSQVNNPSEVGSQKLAELQKLMIQKLILPQKLIWIMKNLKKHKMAS